MEVTLSDDPSCKLLFLLKGYKGTGDINSECQDTACPFRTDLPQNVRIRQNSTDAWGVQKMQLQKYPGSSELLTYSLDGNQSQFWVDGDGDGYNGTCEYGNWCSLKPVGVEGNPFHIIIRSSTHFYKIYNIYSI